jgi:hypothetical protein
VRRLALSCLLALLPSAALAQNSIEGDVSGLAEITDNARLAPEGATKDSDTVFTVRPSVVGKAETRGVIASLRYTLSYYHYSKDHDLDRALHDLAADAKLVWWDNVDLEASEDLIPVPVDFGGPIDNPVNQVQSSHLRGHADYEHEFGPLTRGEIGYVAERVDYLEVHKNDPRPPEYLMHGPALSVDRDLGPRAGITADYRFRMIAFDRNASTPTTGNSTAHVIAVRPHYTPNDELELSGALGYQLVSYENSSGSKGRILINAHVRGGNELLAGLLDYDQHVTQDVAGNSVDEKIATIGGAFTPTAPWGMGLRASYGRMDTVLDPAVNPLGDRAFAEAGANVFYRISVGTIELAGTHHEGLDAGSGSTAPIVKVNRFSLRLGGTF